jgi:hypothetical protein
MGKSTLASLLRGCGPGLLMCEHLEPTGDIVFRNAPKLAARASSQRGSLAMFPTARGAGSNSRTRPRQLCAERRTRIGLTGKPQPRQSWHLTEQHGLWWA